MATMHRSVLIVLLLISACTSAVIPKEKVRQLNREFEGRTYIAIVDIKPEFSDSSDAKTEIIFHKNDRLRLVAENGEEWIRVKAHIVSDRPEQAIGRAIVFILRDDLKKDADPLSEVRARLDKLVSVKR